MKEKRMPRSLTLKFFRSEIVRRKIQDLPASLQEPIRRAVANAGDRVVARARALVPVDEGVLRDSIRWVEVDGARGRHAIRIGPDGAELERRGRIRNLPRWIEFGTAPAQAGKRGVRFGRGGRLVQAARAARRTTAGQPARPFLFPAWRSLKKSVRAAIAAAVNRALRAHAKR